MIIDKRENPVWASLSLSTTLANLREWKDLVVLLLSTVGCSCGVNLFEKATYRWLEIAFYKHMCYLYMFKRTRRRFLRLDALMDRKRENDRLEVEPYYVEVGKIKSITRHSTIMHENDLLDAIVMHYTHIDTITSQTSICSDIMVSTNTCWRHLQNHQHKWSPLDINLNAPRSLDTLTHMFTVSHSHSPRGDKESTNGQLWHCQSTISHITNKRPRSTHYITFCHQPHRLHIFLHHLQIPFLLLIQQPTPNHS